MSWFAHLVLKIIWFYLEGCGCLMAMHRSAEGRHRRGWDYRARNWYRAGGYKILTVIHHRTIGRHRIHARDWSDYLERIWFWAGGCKCRMVMHRRAVGRHMHLGHFNPMPVRIQQARLNGGFRLDYLDRICIYAGGCQCLSCC